MGDYLKPVPTVKKVKTNIERFENLSLKENPKPQPKSISTLSPLLEIVDSRPLSTTADIQEGETVGKLATAASNTTRWRKGHKKQDSTAFLRKVYLREPAAKSLPDDAREILKALPDEEDLFAVLQYLQFGIDKQHDFDVTSNNAKAAQIIHVLVTITVPDQWHRLSSGSLSKRETEIKKSLLSCLSSVAGLGALLALIRNALTPIKQMENVLLKDALSILAALLQGTSFVFKLLESIYQRSEKAAQRLPLWQELIAVLAGSKLLDTVAQAVIQCEDLDTERDYFTWTGDSCKYTAWLGRNVAVAATKLKPHDEEKWKMLAQLTKRGLSIGQRDIFVFEIYSFLLLGQKALWSPMHILLSTLARFESKLFFETMIRDLSRRHLQRQKILPGSQGLPNSNDPAIRGVAAIVAELIQHNELLKECLVEWLTNTHGNQVSIGLSARRAVIAAMGTHEGKLRQVLQRSMERFGDKVQIQYSSVLEQEATAEIILLVIGQLNRTNPESIKSISRSALYLQAVSNRLAASIPRARILGMIVGVAISRLVEPADKVMKFDFEEMDSEGSKRLLGLVEITDVPGSIDDLHNQLEKSSNTSAAPATGTFMQQPKSRSVPPRAGYSKIVSIEEVDESDTEEDELMPYAKPDDDDPDSEDDPTLIDRSKPSAPVYIIDLIKYLKSDDKPDRIELALRTAPSLIRRKAGFGSELSDNFDVLAAALINVQHGMSKDEAQNLRLQSLIACVVALPERMGPWLASMYFEGDFSIVQRASILSTVGLGTRQLSGHTDEPALPQLSERGFASQRLPAHLEAIYAPVNSIARQIEHHTIQPMALEAADKVSGPDVLKVRTFSSRMEVEKKVTQKSKDRQMRVPRNLHKLLVEFFYLPLCCRLGMVLSTRTNIHRSTLFEPHVLRLFLQTLIIMLTTIAPHAVQLPTVTRETLLLLTQLHSVPAIPLDPVVLPPLLQLLLTTLDLNIEAGILAEQNLVSDFGSQIAELMGWIGELSTMAQAPPDEGIGDGLPWTVLAAGCQVKWQDIGKKFQGRILGLIGTDFEEF